MRRRLAPPLPVRDGLNPTRIRVPEHTNIEAFALLKAVISTQRHRHPADDDAAILARFSDGLVTTRRGLLAPTDELTGGTDVWFYRMPAPEVTVPGEIRVVHEDDDLLVVDKPAFLATTPKGAHITESVVIRLRRSTGNDELAPAHRLDRLTSGLLILTKKAEMRGAYQQLFSSSQVQKSYHAIAPALSGTPTVWRSRMIKNRGDLQAHIVPGEPNAITQINDIELLDAHLARYTLQPITGRTHQLRLHMSHAGAPIVGDPLYPVIDDEPENFNSPLRLTAHRISFNDPISSLPRQFDLDFR